MYTFGRMRCGAPCRMVCVSVRVCVWATQRNPTVALRSLSCMGSLFLFTYENIVCKLNLAHANANSDIHVGPRPTQPRPSWHSNPYTIRRSVLAVRQSVENRLDVARVESPQMLFDFLCYTFFSRPIRPFDLRVQSGFSWQNFD